MLLSRRHDYLRRGVRFTPPVGPDAAVRLYERYRGDLRDFLRLLSRAVQQHGFSAPGSPLSAAAIVAVMAPVYRAELVERLGAADAAHLAATYEGRLATSEIRAVDVAARAGVSRPAASKIVQRLLAAGALEPARTERSGTHFRLRGDVSIALGLPD